MESQPAQRPVIAAAIWRAGGLGPQFYSTGWHSPFLAAQNPPGEPPLAFLSAHAPMTDLIMRFIDPHPCRLYMAAVDID